MTRRLMLLSAIALLLFSVVVLIRLIVVPPLPSWTVADLVALYLLDIWTVVFCCWWIRSEWLEIKASRLDPEHPPER